MSYLLRLSTPLESNFKELFSSRNRLNTLSDATVLLAGRCHVGHKNTNHLHVYGGACTLVAATRDTAVCYNVTIMINMAVNKLLKLSEKTINSVSRILQYLKIQDEVLKPQNKTDALPDFVCGLYVS